MVIAGVLGLIIVAMAWPRRQPREQRARRRHPAASAPIRVRLDTIGEHPRWRIANRHGILDVTVDIVTYRPVRSTRPWVSEPIVDPIRISPGRSTTLPSVVNNPALTYDVVVAWTVFHLDGGVQSTRTFTVGPDADTAVEPVPVVPPGDRRGLAVVFGSIAVLLAAVTSLAGWRLLDGDGTSVAGDTTVPIVVTSSTATAAGTTEPARTVPDTTTAVTPEPAAATTGATTTTTTTDATPPTASTTATTAEASTTSTTTTTVPTTTVPADTRRIVIDGRVEDCRFGTDCLIAGFTLDGFPAEGEYICEFEDGSRYAFRYDGDGADDACVTSGTSPSITIEVDGVRSATITRDAPTGS